MSEAQAAAVRLVTEWRATEWKRVGRFRGSKDIEVECKDEHGKPCFKAVRFVKFRIQKGEAVYCFTHVFGDLTDTAWRTVEIHGVCLDVGSYQELPADVMAQYNRARIRVRALLRMYRAAVALLPTIRYRKVVKAA